MYQRFMNIGSTDSTVPMKTRLLTPTSWQAENDVRHSHARIDAGKRSNQGKHRTKRPRNIESELHPQFHPGPSRCAGRKERCTLYRGTFRVGTSRIGRERVRLEGALTGERRIRELCSGV